MNPAVASIRNRALVNALVIVVIVVGVYSLITMPRELNSQVGFNWAFILNTYPGASPEEVERLITIPIEEELSQVPDVDVVIGQSESSQSFVWVKFEQISDRDFERRLEDVRTQVARVELPDDVINSEVREFNSYDFQPVVSVAVSGDVDERTLHDVSRRLEEDLRKIRGLGRVEPIGERRRAILVETDPHVLASHGLDIVDVEDALRLADRNLPAGVLKLGARQFLMRTRAELDGVDDVSAVTLRAGGQGTRLQVGDVAEVIDGFEERTLISRFNGEPAVAINLTKNSRGNTIEIVDETRALIADWQKRLPPGVSLNLYNDESLVVSGILAVLQSNAGLGLLLVILGLMLFVGWRPAMCAAIGIPVTFLLAVTALDWSGDTLNGNTLFGLILVLGMVVDDAIVILENSYRHLQEGKSLEQAAIDGVREVASPVIVSTLTTLAGFLPLVLMPGVMGKFMRIIPITVTLVLIASLIEAFYILPCHFVEWVRLKKSHQKKETFLSRVQDVYEKALRVVLRRRYVTVFLCIVMLAGSMALIPLVGVSMFSGDAISTIGILVSMPNGTQLEETERVVTEFEKVALALPSSELEGVMANVGFQQRQDDWVNAAHYGQVWVDVREATQMDRTIYQIADQLRRDTANILGPSDIDFVINEGGPPSSKPVEVMIKGPDLASAKEVSDLMQEFLRTQPGVFDVQDDAGERQPTLDVVVDREAASRRGLDATRIARSVAAAFGGATAATYRDGDEELDVIVRWPESFRTRQEDLSALRFVAPGGGVIPFSEVAQWEESDSPQTLHRHDRKLAVTVKADIDPEITDLAAVTSAMTAHFDRLQPSYPAVSLEDGGQYKEFTEAFESLAALFGLGLMLNFMLLAGQFKNWTQPFLILAIVPLSFVGAVLGLLISSSPFSITTLYGLVALAGVAINDSIVLVAFTNQLREKGLDRWDSLCEAGRLRLRPILLTSLTTILGLLPMAIGLGGRSATWQPLATTIAAGLAVATVICLFVIPTLQSILDDFQERRGRLLRRLRGRRDEDVVLDGSLPAGATAREQLEGDVAPAV